MTNIFILDDRLARDSYTIADLSLSRVLLMNNSLYPWLILVPMQHNICEIIDLSQSDQQQLISEISIISKIMQQIFTPDKLNIASFGNIVKQLHVHIIVRYKNDACFPESVFGREIVSYNGDIRDNLINIIQDKIKTYNVIN